ncbi:MAG: hypothetical protein CVT95_08005 [Bacteroidetes bacterium HGW-Bacteroidetes-12]|nr:MAG: hypothetical protein CVT95_08005 [Bacteroidetes bacterium HGW-Bacteroidetes-12]
MKITIFVLLALITTLFSCKNEEYENRISELQQDSLTAFNELGGKEDEILEFIVSLNDIEDNLSQIKEREKIITTRFNKGNEITPTMKDQIIEDITLIDNLLQDNKQKMASLYSKLKKSNLKVAELEKMIERLANQVQEKDAQIADLQIRLAQANEQIKVLFDEYNNRLEELSNKEDELNTAFYCFGTSKELLEQGVITKEGGFIGIRKSKKLADDFNKKYFTKIDISLVNQIDIVSKKASIVTTHPTSSYELSPDKLVIKDTKEFWAASKYLVIIVD